MAQKYKGTAMARKKKKDGKHICKCECGGEVRGVESLGRMFTWCEKCTPITKIAPDAIASWYHGDIDGDGSLA
jgi:hypothetical protein